VAAAKAKAKSGKVVAKTKITKAVAKPVKAGKKRPVEEEEDEATTNGSAELEEEEEEVEHEEADEDDEFD